MKKFLLIISLLMLVNICNSQIKLDTSMTQQENYMLKSNAFLQYGFVIPQNLDECVLILMHKDSAQLCYFMTKTEEEAEQLGFDEYNNRLRNTWDLDNGSVIAQYFYNKKVYNTEVMKSIVLVALHRYLSTNDTNFDEIITKYKKVYKKDNAASKKRIYKQSKSRYNHHKKITKRINKERKKALKQETKEPEFDEFFD